MDRILQRLTLAAIALATTLAILAPATPAAALDKPLRCIDAGHNYGVIVTYETASNHRLTVTDVKMHDSIDFYSLSVYVRDASGRTIAQGQTGGNFNQGYHHFYWPDRWMTATKSAPATVDTVAVIPGLGGLTSVICE